MRRRRWFLPEQPDVLGLLRHQLAVTIEGLDALVAWGAGDPAAAERVRAAEPRGDAAKRELIDALRAAFVIPFEPEDVFVLSRGIDWILNHARDLIDQSEAMECAPDTGIAEMAELLRLAVLQIDDAIAGLSSDSGSAIKAADAAIATERKLEYAYYRGMAALLEVEDRNERIARRELYRHCSTIGETVVDVAERIVYAVVKQS